MIQQSMAEVASWYSCNIEERFVNKMPLKSQLFKQRWDALDYNKVKQAEGYQMCQGFPLKHERIYVWLNLSTT